MGPARTVIVLLCKPHLLPLTVSVHMAVAAMLSSPAEQGGPETHYTPGNGIVTWI